MGTPPGDLVLFGSSASDRSAWQANAATGSRAHLTAETGPAGPALCFDFALAGHGAWAIARRTGALVLPQHYVVSAVLHGEATPSELQVKLVDASGANVWWWRLPGFRPEAAPARRVLRRASLRFAWGPQSGGDPHQLGAVELAVAADGGASGRLWIDDLRIEPRALSAGPPRAQQVRASSAAAASRPENLLDPSTRAGWRPDPGDPAPWLELDLGTCREWGGLRVDLAAGGALPRCRLLGSEDGVRWDTLADEQVRTDRFWLRSGEAESRLVRLAFPEGLARTVTRLSVVPIELAVSPARFAASVARSAPRGRLPRHLLGEHAYWAVVGADGDERKGLLGEDGALEVEAEGFTLEPFLQEDGTLFTWADVESRPSLEDGALPIPSVTWLAGDLRLRITAFAAGPAGSATLVASYAITNTGTATRAPRLVVAIRPFQVTPEWQALNLVPAIAPIERLVRDGARVLVGPAHRVVSVSAPDAVVAAAPGSGPGAFLDGPTEALVQSDDPLGFAECAFHYALRIAPGVTERVVLAVPLGSGATPPPAALPRDDARAFGEARLAETVASWKARLAGIPLSLPPAARPWMEALHASVAWILVNREGARIQPGPRCYRRSWIRDGALTGTALAELGFADEARAFLRWYAPFQGADGRVPCAVDRRGIDRAIEHDSHGELAWAVVEVWRLTGDDAFLRALWPNVLRAVDAIAALRAERTTGAFRGDPRFGLLPESISHEGYASQPVHSFWDDFFALRALADAADAAAALGDPARDRIRALHHEMRRDVHAALAATMQRHAIDFLPGSVELGDFDPTSTAIACDPCGEDARLPRAALEHTFARYWEELEERRSGSRHQDAYTAYEIRNAVALLRLGWIERAHALLEHLVADQRPPAWRQWPEVSTRDPRAPRFLGDLPHGWIASSFLRSVRRLLVDERRDEGVLVIASGVPEAWVRDADGVRLRGLPTIFGPLDLVLRAEGDDGVRFHFGGACRPPGGIVLYSPCARSLRQVWIDGRAGQTADPRRVVLAGLPRDVLLVY